MRHFGEWGDGIFHERELRGISIPNPVPIPWQPRAVSNEEGYDTVRKNKITVSIEWACVE
jgi:hypothetical protein